MSKTGAKSLNDFTYRNIIGRGGRMFKHFIGKIYTYETMELLVDIGTPEAYKSVNSLNSKNIN